MTLTDLLPILLAAYDTHGGELKLGTGFDEHKPIFGVLISQLEKDCEIGKKGELFVDFY